MAEPPSPAEVVIVGGGVAALEALLALRDLVPGRVNLAPYLFAREPGAVPAPAPEAPAPEGFTDLGVPLHVADAAAARR